MQTCTTHPKMAHNLGAQLTHTEQVGNKPLLASPSILTEQLGSRWADFDKI
jgi:hypothetical protein